MLHHLIPSVDCVRLLIGLTIVVFVYVYFDYSILIADWKPLEFDFWFEYG